MLSITYHKTMGQSPSLLSTSAHSTPVHCYLEILTWWSFAWQLSQWPLPMLTLPLNFPPPQPLAIYIVHHIEVPQHKGRTIFPVTKTCSWIWNNERKKGERERRKKMLRIQEQVDERSHVHCGPIHSFLESSQANFIALILHQGEKE